MSAFEPDRIERHLLINTAYMEENLQPNSTNHEALIRLIVKAYQYAESEPEACLNFARKSIEAICRHLYATRLGSPGKMMLEELIHQLSRQELLPPRIIQPIVTVQKYGNFAAHAQDQSEAIGPEYTVPCVAALMEVSRWFFRDCLKSELPGEIETAWNYARPRSRGKQASVSIVPVHELLEAGWSMERIIQKTMGIDYETLPGLLPTHEGEHAQWVSVVQDHPETVRLLMDRSDNIVGYWHIIPLFPKEFKRMKRGELLTTDITSDMICMLELPGTYDVYFLILTILTPYRQVSAIRLLFESFLDALEAFAEAGIFFRELCTDAYTPMGAAICKSFEMKLVRTHPDRGSIYARKCFPFPKHALFAGRNDLAKLYFEHFAKGNCLNRSDT